MFGISVSVSFQPQPGKMEKENRKIERVSHVMALQAITFYCQYAEQEKRDENIVGFLRKERSTTFRTSLQKMRQPTIEYYLNRLK